MKNKVIFILLCAQLLCSISANLYFQDGGKPSENGEYPQECRIRKVVDCGMENLPSDGLVQSRGIPGKRGKKGDTGVRGEKGEVGSVGIKGMILKSIFLFMVVDYFKKKHQINNLNTN